MTIEVNNESGVPIDETEFVAVARFAFDKLHLDPKTELSIVFADEQVMEELHVRWMDEPGPTDVLSFPMDELRPGHAGAPAAAGLLGDIVVCPTVTATQAVRAGHSAVEEMLLLTIHGILHLLGYDHVEPDEEKEMFALQRELLLTFLADR